MAVRRDLVTRIPGVNHITRERRRGGPTVVKYVLEAPYDRERGYARPKRVTIGHVVPGSETEMHPTDGFREVFPEEWERLTGEPVPPAVRKVGMRVATEAALDSTGIRECLRKAFDAPTADAIVDYAMNAVIHHTDAACSVESGLSDQLPFSGEAREDSFYSRLFRCGMSGGRIISLKREWARRCAELGAEEVWICIDGSNDDCKSTGVEIAERGKAKSRKAVKIVSFTYAVTEDGLPVTFDEYRGGLVDAKAMRRIIDFLLACGVRVRGVVLDRGYCDGNVTRYLRDNGIPYVIMVKGTPEGLRKAREDYGEKIKYDAKYLVEGTQVFAAQEEVRLFRGSKETDHLTLMYDHVNASERVATLLKNLWKDMSAAAEAAAAGREPSIPARSKALLSVGEGGEVALDRSALQPMIDEKGLYAIVSSEKMPPSRVHGLYVARGGTEKQYALLKTQLGFGTVRVRLDASVHARACCAFVACVIRHQIEVAARAVGSDANRMIREMNLIEAVSVNGTYAYTHSENERQRAFLKALGTTDARIDEVVRAENDRLSGRERKPRHHKTGPKRATPKSPSERLRPGPKPGFKRGELNKDGSPRKRPGPKPGFKRGEFNKDGSRRRRPGPKPGSHNVRTTGRAS